MSDVDHPQIAGYTEGIGLDEKSCQRCSETFHRAKRRSRKNFAAQKYCSEACSQKAIPRRGRPRRGRCLKDLHDLDEANTRIDHRGHRSCKACAREGERIRRLDPRKRPARVILPPEPRSTPTEGTVAPRVVTTPARPPWRPAGFTPQPRIPQRREKAS